MACVTLKRSLDHDASPVASTKRRRFQCSSRSPSSPNSVSQLPNGSSTLTFVPPPAEPLASESSAAAAADFPASRLPPELLSQRLTAEVRRLQRRRMLPSQPMPQATVSAGAGSDSEMAAPNACAHCGASTAVAIASARPSSSQSPSSEPPLFTLSQVQSIAEKLLADREQQIRSEFQALLSAKLQEQYDAFLRFNHDQIYRMHSGAPMSYVS